ncbi:MAG: hypothetical protein ACXU9C_00585, partial [Xanthobacteraceae bacterium]
NASTNRAHEIIEIAPEIAEIDGTLILRDLGVFFSGPDLAEKVYEAMEQVRRATPKQSSAQNRVGQ